MEMLIKILDGDEATASALVQIIYDHTCLDQVDSVAPDLELALDDIAIWIDPIGERAGHRVHLSHSN